MTAVAPASSAARANERWRAFSLVERSTPQWNVATTTSERRAAARTPSAIACGVANEVPGRPGPAKNDAGWMSEKPTKAIRRPRRLTTCGRRAARKRRARADGQRAGRAHRAHGVEQRVGAVVAAWLFARFRTSRPANLTTWRRRSGRPGSGTASAPARRGWRSRTRGCRTRVRGRAGWARRPATATARRGRP